MTDTTNNTVQNTTDHKLYAIQAADERYFKGFDSVAKVPMFVDKVLEAKMFNNKYDVRLRPTENIVEITVTLTPQNTSVSAPFRPRLRQKDISKKSTSE